MEIKGLTAEQIEQALAEANKNYNGNLRIEGTSVMEDIEPWTETITYRMKDYDENYRWLGTYTEHSYEIEHTRRYVKDVPTPLNKKGTRHKMLLRVVSSRRPGSRVGDGRGMGKPRRIASACWHANRDFYRAIFAINPDATIRTALATYKGEEDFEDTFRATGVGHTGPFGFPIPAIEDLCNCDEGQYPEYATEGLTAEQYAFRAPIWADYPDYSDVKPPKREQAIINEEATA